VVHHRHRQASGWQICRTQGAAGRLVRASGTGALVAALGWPARAGASAASGKADEMSGDLHAFLRAAFAAASAKEKVELAHARPRRDGNLSFWPSRWVDGAVVDPYGLHNNVATFQLDACRATASNAVLAHVAMLDDIGEIPGKSFCSAERVLELDPPPHAYISTRADRDGRLNGQAVWFIEPTTPDKPVALVRAAAKAGWCDPNGIHPTRWMRPPESIKLKGDGHVARLVVANFDRDRVRIEDLASALGVDLQRQQGRGDRRAGHGGEYQRQDAVRPPQAELTRMVLDAIPNFFGRDDWVRIGMATKACCGSPPALGDDEGLQAFLDFSREHPTFNELHTRRFWATAQPTGSVGFGTLVHFAREAGFDAVDLEIGATDQVSGKVVVAFDEDTARATMMASGIGHALVVSEIASSLFVPAITIRDVLIAVPDRNPHADAFGLHDRGPALNRLATRLARMRLMVRMITVQPLAQSEKRSP
jgi:hypothetical protein